MTTLRFSVRIYAGLSLLNSGSRKPQRIRSDFAACRLATSMSISPKVGEAKKGSNLARSCVLRATLLPKTVGRVAKNRLSYCSNAVSSVGRRTSVYLSAAHPLFWAHEFKCGSVVRESAFTVLAILILLAQEVNGERC
jgi:hypothetical protein